METKTLELVLTSKSGKDVTTSLIVADVFGKEHKHVLRDIKELTCSREFRERNFALSYYLTSQGKELPMYEITKNGFSFLAMGFTGERAGEFKEKFIAEFDKRDSLLKNDDYIIGRAISVLSERQRLLEQQILQKDEQIEVAKPKVEYYDNVLQSSKLIPTTIIAKELGMTAGKLNSKLHELGVQHKVNGTWVLYSKYENKEYTGTKTHLFEDSKGNETTSILTYWTEKGREFIHEIINKN